MCGVLHWLTKYEAIAIWLEGIALLLIFFWDRFDARDQIETTHRPFVSYMSTVRAAEEAILGVGGTDAATEIYCPGRQAQIKNYGSGPAINIRYALTPTYLKSTVARPEGFLVALRQGGTFRSPIPCGILQGNEWETVITYDSLTGRKYQTKITSDNLVMTKISVSQPRWWSYFGIGKWRTG